MRERARVGVERRSAPTSRSIGILLGKSISAPEEAAALGGLEPTTLGIVFFWLYFTLVPANQHASPPSGL